MRDVKYASPGEELFLSATTRPQRIDLLHLLLDQSKAAPLAFALGTSLARQSGRQTLLLDRGAPGLPLFPVTAAQSANNLDWKASGPGSGGRAGDDLLLYELQAGYDEIVVLAGLDTSPRPPGAMGSTVIVVDKAGFSGALELAAMLEERGEPRAEIAVLTDAPVTSDNGVGGLWQPSVVAQRDSLESQMRESGVKAGLRLLPRDDGLLARISYEGPGVLEDHASHPFCKSVARLARRLGGTEVGIALGAGLARGFAHIGVLKVLAEEDIPFDYIAGSSIGSIVGSVFAGGMDLARLQELMTGADRRFLRPTLPLKSISSNVGLKKILTGCHERAPTARFAELFIPFTAVATELSSGAEVPLNEGLVWSAVLASVSMPGIFPPVPHAGKVLVDGGLVNPVPVRTVRQMGADIVIAVDLTSSGRRGPLAPAEAPIGKTRVPNIVETLWRTMEIMVGQISRHTAAGADVIIRPKVKRTRVRDFSRRGPEIIACGEKAAELALPEIKALMCRQEIVAA